MSGTRVMWLAGVAAAMLVGCQAQQGNKSGPTEPVAILGRLHANDPALKQPEVILITSRAQLDKTGSSELSHLNVDFNRQSLVVLALGEKPTGGYWGKITGVQRKGDELYVQGVANRPAVDQVTTQVLSYPIDAVVVPRQDKVRVVESEIESVSGQALPADAPAPMAAPAPKPVPATK